MLLFLAVYLIVGANLYRLILTRKGKMLKKIESLFQLQVQIISNSVVFIKTIVAEGLRFLFMAMVAIIDTWQNMSNFLKKKAMIF